MIKYKNIILVSILLLIGVIPLADFFHPGLPVTHDGQDHVARIANFYQNLKEGNIIPRWAANLNWGYGHPILMFLYPLPSYIVSLFHFLGFSLVGSIKILFGASFVLSGFVMYLWVRNFLSGQAAMLAAVMYMLAPYRFVDLYVRGAIGEHVAFIFPPLIFYFLLKLSHKYSYWYLIGGAFSIAGLILSHNAITLMFLPIIILYVIYLFWYCKYSLYFILNTLYIILLGLGLSAFFWIPAFMEGKYTLRDIVTGDGEYIVSFVMWKDFFFSQWSYGGTVALSKQIGIVHWAGIFSSIIATYYLYRNKNKLWMVSLGSFLIFWITLFLMTSASNPIWQSITTLQKFQFPWRFLSLTVFLSSLLGAIALNSFPDKYKKFFLLILVAGLLVVNKDYWHANGFLYKPESFYTGIYNSTTDTGESAPIWSVRFMEKEPRAHMEIIEGKGEVQKIERTSTKHAYVVTLSARSRLRENTLYFPGWEVLVDGQKTAVEFQDPANRGLITFLVEQGKHKVELRFGETKLRFFADFISGISFAILSFWGIITKRALWPRFR